MLYLKVRVTVRVRAVRDEVRGSLAHKKGFKFHAKPQTGAFLLTFYLDQEDDSYCLTLHSHTHSVQWAIPFSLLTSINCPCILVYLNFKVLVPNKNETK